MNGYATNILYNGTGLSGSNALPVHLASMNPMQTDAFGRLRTSNIFTLFDSFHRYQDNGKLTEHTNGAASSRHDASSGTIVMTVDTSAGDAIYRESSRVFAYQPGKSLLILQTFCMAAGKSGLRQRQGYFDAHNGVYVQLDGSTLSFVRRSSVSGTVKETVVSQDDWNHDTLKGDGVSGYTLDITRVQIMFIDIEWLGVGSVRMGFVIDGKFCLCHVFHHANQPSTAVSDTTLPYMTTACLPIRAELENITNTTSVSNYRLICTTVISEGGYELRGRQRSVGFNVNSPKTLFVGGTLYPVISIRLKSDRLGAIVLPTQLSIVGTVASDYEWKIVTNATINGAWTSAGTDSSVEYNIDASNAIVDGTVLKSGVFVSASNSSPNVNLDAQTFKYQLERNTFTGQAYTFTLAVTGKSNNDKVLATLDFEEVT